MMDREDFELNCDFNVPRTTKTCAMCALVDGKEFRVEESVKGSAMFYLYVDGELVAGRPAFLSTNNSFDNPVDAGNDMVMSEYGTTLEDCPFWTPTTPKYEVDVEVV